MLRIPFSLAGMPMSLDLQTQLNERQLEAVEHTEGPLLILAGAGSGKTRTITYKIAYLIESGHADPEEILAVTFTNKAAGEMRDRVAELLQRDDPPLVCTFHSFGVRLLRRFASHVDYRTDFTICDVDDQKRLYKQVFQSLPIADGDLPLEKARGVVSWCKNRSWGPETYLEKSKDFDAELIHRVWLAYQALLQRSQAFDFDDLILQSVRILREQEEVRNYFGRRYRYLLIDEYQDTNQPQYELVRLLTEGRYNITAVGDEDQSIYAFRGADINNILRFEKDFPGAKIVKLEQNYRSTQNILDAATAVVSNNVKRKGKSLWTKQPKGTPITVFVASNSGAEAEFVAGEIQRFLREGVSGVAILYRTNFQSRPFEEALRRRSIPYRLIGSVSFYQRKEVRDALAYLRVLLNPNDDVSLGRILNEPPRGLGQTTRSRIVDLASREGISLYEAVEMAVETRQFAARAHAALQDFLGIFSKCRSQEMMPLHMTLQALLNHSGYSEALKQENSEESASRLGNLEELLNVARERDLDAESVHEFLDEAALHADTDDLDDSADVTMMTLHNAKGLEFPVVFLTGMEEGLFPHSRSVAENELEEERRLCYVGLTRARRRLYLSYSRYRRFYGRDVEEANQPSRFLHEIPSHLLEPVVSAGRAFDSRPVRLTANSLVVPKRERQGYGGATYDSVESVRQFLAQRQAAGKDGGIAPGTRIRHQKFGEGKVLKVEDSGEDLKVTVMFPGIGIKRMLQSYANLKPI
jgi:DNA helicase II / ATP-dependent DNA helicase PcrA